MSANSTLPSGFTLSGFTPINIVDLFPTPSSPAPIAPGPLYKNASIQEDCGVASQTTNLGDQNALEEKYKVLEEKYKVLEEKYKGLEEKYKAFENNEKDLMEAVSSLLILHMPIIHGG
ncbi:hypothetical protein TWF481_002933 [Arthrobotrys musiformis]|uniref:Uncharacterized protein n=1 Tax=Arthrobotrys musiformis TaxID=47236 RepID=A0AAV9VTF0_9PEZI